MQVKCIPYDQTGDLGSNIIKFQLQSQFQRFIHQTVCVFSQIKDMKHIEQNFILSPGPCPRVGLGGTGVQKLERGDLGWCPIECAFQLKLH